ncbi:hypothetical protein KUF83_30125 [Streptomyces sp. BV286]|uniref:hypothetical protein n=1 Tax=Streptomyces sp. BV286 TaxID=2849672 RepID=UPI001C2E23A4|nr:hypothetical protein [Streptomyces sp. BV286]MBV1940794.1 hypothetical protein [Streptomyces sp. BV286]
MPRANLADRINRLPFAQWMCASESARLLDLPFEEAQKVLKAGRRHGSITVERHGEVPRFKRVRRHPFSGTRS